MKITTVFQNSTTQGMYRLFFLGLAGLLLTNFAYAQKRNPDLILTVKKDTLSVRITDVGILDLQYKKLTGDTAMIYTVTKTDVIRVFYGNGDEEEFKSAPAQATFTDRRYYKMIVKTPFQKEIALWSKEKLMTQKGLYREKYIAQRTGGILAIPVGAVVAVVGIGQAISYAFSFDNGRSDEPTGAPLFISGIVIATGIGVPLTVFSVKSKKKYRAINMELELRGVRTE